MDNNYYGNICYCRKCNGIVHTIKKGDTLYLLSRYYNVPIGEIMNANRNLNIYNLQIGQEICIPIRRSDMMNDTINGSPMTEARPSGNEMAVTPSDTANSSEGMSSAMDRSFTPEQVQNTAPLSNTEVSKNTFGNTAGDAFDQSIAMSALIADKNMTFEKFMELVHKF